VRYDDRGAGGARLRVWTHDCVGDGVCFYFFVSEGRTAERDCSLQGNRGITELRFFCFVVEDVRIRIWQVRCC